MSRGRSPFGAHPVAGFFLLAYLLSWLCWLPEAAGLVGGTTGTVLSVGGTFGPAVAAALVTWLTGGSVRGWLSQVARWRVRPRYYAAALLLPVLAVFGTAAVHVLAFGGRVTPAVLPAVLQYPVVLLLVLLFFGGQEEPGWRGFALPHLQGRYGALGASLVVGVVWAGWHLPRFLTPGTVQSAMSFPLYALWTVAASVVYTWLYNSAGGSVLPVALLHAGGNALVNYYPVGGPVGFATPAAQAGLVAVAVVAAALVVRVYGPARLADRPVPGPGRGGGPAPAPDD